MESRPSQSGRLSSSSSSRFNNETTSRSNSNLNSSSQSLSSILNNPHVASDASWVGWWSSSTAVPVPEFAPLGVTTSNKAGVPELTRSDFIPYLGAISDQYGRFEDIQNHSNKESGVDLVAVEGEGDSGGGRGGQAAGEALVACLREVPALYFKEDLIFVF